MDPYEATKVVFSRVQSLDPTNASKIMGLLLVQDHGEKEMIRLAFGPENLLHSVVVKARQELGIFPNTPSTPTPSSPSPFLPNQNNNIFSRQTSSSSSSRFLKIPTSLTLPTLVSPSSPSWGTSVFPDFNQNPDDLISPMPISSSSANNNTTSFGTMTSTTTTTTTNSSTLNPSTPPFYATSTRSNSLGINGVSELMDDVQLQEQLSFLNENSPTLRPKSTDLYFPHAELELGGGVGVGVGDFNHHGVSRTASSVWGENGNGLPHRRSCSVSDISMASLLDDPASGLGWKPCVYYARGFCKNGSSCRFVHGGGMLSESEAAALVGSPSKLEMMEHCHELLRSKSMQQQKLLAAAMASASASSSASAASFPYSLNKGLSLFAQQQQNDSPRAAAAAAAMLMSEDLHKFSRSPRGLDNGRGDSSPASRQIYLTFPADSTFREEDVSNYFSIYGPVQDVRIPYQQKRMFGFVTFVYPETVKIILAKGNPHFVCDARVLVKPYKEKGKVPDKLRKQQQQQMERGDFSACNSPTALDSRDPFDLPLGARSMMYDTQTQYILWRRKLEEQTDLQQALELQSRRLMGLQLLDVKRTLHHRSLSTGAPPIHSPTQSPNSIFNQPLLSSDRSSPDASDENCASPPLNEAKQALQQAINEAIDREKESSVGGEDNSNNCNAKENPCHEDNLINLAESLEHNLPDSPFASPKKGGREYLTSFSNNAAVGEGGLEALSNLAPTSAESNSKASPFHPATATLDMTPFKSSCYFQMPRFSPGHGAIGM